MYNPSFLHLASVYHSLTSMQQQYHHCLCDILQPRRAEPTGILLRRLHDGAPTRILVAPDGRSITIVNEFGKSSDGYAADPRNLAIPSLGITGKVSKDGRRITWTNGTEWRRDSSMPGPIPTVNIGGRWFRNGQPTSIDVARDGRNFTIVQELGLRANG